jgi:small subunit ribosomal protein S9
MDENIWSVGRRKESVARLSIKDGSGKIFVNGRTFDEYFQSDTMKILVKQPLDVVDKTGKFDIDVKVNGGGLSSQVGAIKLALARALVKTDPATKQILHKGGFLTRDPRMRERKKYGQEGARKKFQWTKR